LLVLRLMPPERAGSPVPWHFDPLTGMARAEYRAHHVAVAASRRPLLVTVHDSLEALRQEMEEKGYWYLESRGTSGPVMALRFNLEEMPELSFAAAVGDDIESAIKQAQTVLFASSPSRLAPLAPQDEDAGRRGALAPREEDAGSRGALAAQDEDAIRNIHPHPEVAAQRPSKDEDARLAAVRDVVAWNTVWDPVNNRPYTTLSRNWGAQKFGGWGVWLDDLFFHALMASLVDADIARENLEAALSNATPYG